MISEGSWDLRIDHGVFKSLQKFPAADREAALYAIKLLTFNPYAGDIQKLRGEENAWRRRVSSYRIFYKLFNREKIILVFRIERRGSKIYRHR
ncbi:type II toxin-antitoxin system RelE/ParE family toxin [Candidatus Wolfebacteria bacterium]|nr:type II toxin-antitoxin system RelE/ParE family toxin [Candidatus Wolfebacteria bacterium]